MTVTGKVDFHLSIHYIFFSLNYSSLERTISITFLVSYFIFHRERKKKVEDILRNIRDAILVRSYTIHVNLVNMYKLYHLAKFPYSALVVGVQ